MAIFCNVTADRKTRITEPLAIFHIITPCHRHVVHNPVNDTVTLHNFSKYTVQWKQKQININLTLLHLLLNINYKNNTTHGIVLIANPNSKRVTGM